MTKAVIYTCGGDKGLTSLLDGARVKKYYMRVETYGTVDELNSHIGFAQNFLDNEIIRERLKKTQGDLFALSGELADPSGEYTANFTEDTVKKLENWIDEALQLYDPAPKFIVPGTNMASGAMHIARTVCRRTERLMVKLNDRLEINPLLIKYINRLSDLLYIYARYIEDGQKLPRPYGAEAGNVRKLRNI